MLCNPLHRRTQVSSTTIPYLRCIQNCYWAVLWRSSANAGIESTYRRIFSDCILTSSVIPFSIDGRGYWAPWSIDVVPIVHLHICTQRKHLQHGVFHALHQRAAHILLLATKTPQTFNHTLRYLLSMFEAVMVNNTPGELFKHYLSDLSMTLNAAQFFYSTAWNRWYSRARG